MKIWIWYAFLISLTVRDQVAYANQDCRDWSAQSYVGLEAIVRAAEPPSCKQKFRDEILSKTVPSQFALKNVMDSKPDLIAIGESHTFGAGKTGYVQFLNDIEKSGFHPDCVTFELPQDTKPVIDEMLSGHRPMDQGTFDAGVGGFGGGTMFQVVQFLKIKRIPAYVVDEGFGWPSAEAAMRDGNLTKLDRVLKNSVITHSVAERNHYMAQQISLLRKKHLCHKIIHIGGFNHLSLSNQPSSRLGELLSKDGIRTVSIGLQPQSDYWAFGKFIPTALRCEQGTPNLAADRKTFAIHPGPLEVLITPLGADGQGQIWGDYDAIFFFPTQK